MSAFAALTAALDSADPVVAADAARLLGETGDPAAIGHLLRYARTSRHHHKVLAVHALAALAPVAGEKTLADLRRKLRDLLANPNTPDDWYWTGHRGLKASIAVTLLALGDTAGADFLHSLADRNDDVFCGWLAPAILRLPDTPAAAPVKTRLTLEAVLNPPPGSIRRSEPGLMVMKAQTLGLFAGRGEAGAEGPLLELTRFHSRYVRGQAALSLLESAAGANGRAKRHVAVVKKLHQSDPTDFVKIQTARGLGLFGPLIKLAGRAGDPLDRATALEAIGALGSPPSAAVAAVERELKHPHPYVRQTAMGALERLDRGRAQALAKKLAKDPDPRVRLQAQKAMLRRPAVSATE